jgi:hypothetical protein
VRSTLSFAVAEHLAPCKFDKIGSLKLRESKLNKSDVKDKDGDAGQIELEKHKPFYKRLIISPDAKWKSVFDIWVLLFVGYSCIWNILVFAFTFTPGLGLKYLNVATEVIFYLDFFLTFFQAFKNPDTYEVIDDFKQIAINYFWGWFLIDLVSIFPFTLFLNSEAQDQAQTVKLARLFRMPRLGKLIDVGKIKKLLKSF